MGNRVFGCDICQEVCPFNERRAEPTEEPAFQARPATQLTLAELAEMTEEEFRVAFKGSPVKRAKWRGLMRNIAAALSASEDPGAKATLTQALDHPEEFVRQQAASSLSMVPQGSRREDRPTS
jgi:epoxyqueuosine reductase